MDWKLAAPDEYVCWCKKVDKGTIVKAIQLGANTLDQIKEKTTACTGDDCYNSNPSKRCCSTDIEKLIEIYGKPLGDAPQRCSSTGCCS